MIIVNNRDKIPWNKDLTIKKVFDIMGYDFAMVIVSVNGEVVPEEEYGTFLVPDKADVSLIHIAHGG